MKHTNVVRGYGMWQHPIAIKAALCEDGIRRTIRLNMEADSYFSWPGRTTIRKQSVCGFVTCEDGDYIFTANKSTK